jgi:hypothetical protein
VPIHKKVVLLLLAATVLLSYVIAKLTWPEPRAVACERVNPELIGTGAAYAFTARVLTTKRFGYQPDRDCEKLSEGKPQCGGRQVTLFVGDVFRGNVKNVVTVLAPDACKCHGLQWSDGDEYVVVARPNTSSLEADFIAESQCGGTGLISERADVLTALRKPAPIRVQVQER